MCMIRARHCLLFHITSSSLQDELAEGGTKELPNDEDSFPNTANCSPVWRGKVGPPNLPQHPRGNWRSPCRAMEPILSFVPSTDGCRKASQSPDSVITLFWSLEFGFFFPVCFALYQWSLFMPPFFYHSTSTSSATLLLNYYLSINSIQNAPWKEA